jgi:hypothetical protein
MTIHEGDVGDWEDFERRIKELRSKYPSDRALVFRGLSDSTWRLTTTLERHGNVDMPFAEYYRAILLFRMIENPTVHESWHAAARHQARRCPTKVVPANVDLVPLGGYSLRLGDNIRACTLCEAAPRLLGQLQQACATQKQGNPSRV